MCVEFAPAYWLEVFGFSNSQLNLSNAADLASNPNPKPTFNITIDSSLNPTLTVAQISTISSKLGSIAWGNFGPAPIGPADPTLQANGQTFFYPYTVTFPDASIFDSLNADQSAVLTISASLTVGQIARTDSANIELTAGENPFFADLNPAAPTAYPSWLSFDLRFFKVVIANTAGATTKRFSANITNNPSDATTFIASVIGNLTAGRNREKIGTRTHNRGRRVGRCCSQDCSREPRGCLSRGGLNSILPVRRPVCGGFAIGR